MDLEKIWRTAKGVLGAVAPTLGMAVGGPLASQAASAIAAALGMAADTPPEQLASAVARATPEQLLALKLADQSFISRMEELGIERERIAATDRDSARDRQVAMRDWTPAVLAAVVIIGWVAVQLLLLTAAAPPVIGDATLGRVLGTLDGALIIVLSYYFGSSAGSARKDAVIAGSTK